MPRTSRAPARKTPLSREVIVKAALALVEKEGLDAFSTRSLGRALRCEAMSIYHFFPSKQHLTDAMVDQVVGEFEFPDASLAPLEQLRRACHEYRAMSHRHPRFFPVIAVHRLNTEAGVRFIERLLGLARAVTGDDERAARHFRALGYYLMGAGLDETSGYAKGPSAAEPASDEFIARECPQLARSARYFQKGEWDKTFEAGLEAMLAGLDPGPSRRKPRPG